MSLDNVDGSYTQRNTADEDAEARWRAHLATGNAAAKQAVRAEACTVTAPGIQDDAPTLPTADVGTIRRFANAVFKGIEPGKGHVMLRSFEHFGEQWSFGRSFPFGKGLVPAAANAATDTASRRGDKAAVFCPPPCVFGDKTVVRRGGSVKIRASEDNVVACSVIPLELDESPREMLAKATAILGVGTPTLLIRSGGVWEGPDGPEDKVHAYWRLTEPATTEAELFRLKAIRNGLHRLCGGDGTAVPICHPMRWPGSWHTKGTPRLSVIESQTEHEISLEDAEARVTLAAEIAGVDITQAPAGRRRDGGFKSPTALCVTALNALADAIPNPPGLPWDDWNTRGLTFFDASHGSPEGLEAFHRWSQKNEFYDPEHTEHRWEHFHMHPPSDLSAGTLVHLAKGAEPGFRLPFDVEKHFDTDAAATYAQPAGPDVPAYVELLNRSHALVMNNGQSAVLNIEDGGGHSFSKPCSFRDRYANHRVIEEKRYQSVADLWWRHPRRRQYPNGVDFAPEGVGDGVYNLWPGFHPRGAAAAPNGSCVLILAHIRDILCNGNLDAYDYLIGWLAHMVQQPEDKPGVAVILKGAKGTGKDTLGVYLDAMMPGLRFCTAQQDHVTGRFTGHLAQVLLLHLEEAIWAGAKQGESILKSLITSPTLAVEPKGLTPFTVRSKLRVLMTSNEEWVVPATAGERRFFVCEVSTLRQQDTDYFGAILQERDSGGAAALLAHLMQIDLSGFNVRRVPNTGGLQNQKIATLQNFDRWYYEQLADGSLWPDDSAPSVIERDRLFTCYRAWLEHRRYDGPAWAKERIGRLLREIVPKDWAVETRPRTAEGGRSWAYLLPPLSVSRTCWEAHYGVADVF